MRLLLAEAEAAGAFDVVEFPDCGAEAGALPPEGAARRVVRFHSPAELIMPLYVTASGDRRLCAALERRSIARAGQASACSAFLGREAERLGLARAPEAVPNGIDVPPPAPRSRAWRDRLGLGTERPVLLFAARLEPRKGVDLLVEIVPELLERHDVSVVVAGDDLFGHAARELEPRLAGRRLNGRLRRLGRLPLDAVRALQLESDIVWAPSRWESCPYSVLETMVAGRSGAALVASDVGGVPELVRHGEEALLAPAGDAAAHRAAIEALLEAPERRHALAAAALRRVERDFGARAIAERSLELYRRAADGAPR
jgi:glycosyltransferase involved in cell wall biosynthesis